MKFLAILSAMALYCASALRPNLQGHAVVNDAFLEDNWASFWAGLEQESEENSQTAADDASPDVDTEGQNGEEVHAVVNDAFLEDNWASFWAGLEQESEENSQTAADDASPDVDTEGQNGEEVQA